MKTDEMEIPALQMLLSEVFSISKKYEDIAKITGEKFNIFQILRLSTNEVRTHSAFLAELLNPKGNHGQGDTFLKLFLSQLSNLEIGFDTNNSSVEVEKHIGQKNENCTEGGNLDIIVSNNNSAIVIENKIYAGDQEKQLIRYYNYVKKNYSNFGLIYLTLNGDSPSDQSIKDKDEHIELKEGIDFIKLSYEKDIIKWLELCLKEASSFPLLRETITQYIYLIKILTNQTTNHKMEKEIVNSIVANTDNIKAAFAIANSYNSIIVQLISNLANDLKKESNWEDKKDTDNWPGFCYKPDKKKYRIYVRWLEGKQCRYQIDLLLFFDEEQNDSNKQVLKEKIELFAWYTDKIYIYNAWIPDNEWKELFINGSIKERIKQKVITIVEALKDIPSLDLPKNK